MDDTEDLGVLVDALEEVEAAAEVALDGGSLDDLGLETHPFDEEPGQLLARGVADHAGDVLPLAPEVGNAPLGVLALADEPLVHLVAGERLHGGRAAGAAAQDERLAGTEGDCLATAARKLHACPAIVRPEGHQAAEAAGRAGRAGLRHHVDAHGPAQRGHAGQRGRDGGGATTAPHADDEAAAGQVGDRAVSRVGDAHHRRGPHRGPHPAAGQVDDSHGPAPPRRGHHVALDQGGAGRQRRRPGAHAGHPPADKPCRGLAAQEAVARHHEERGGCGHRGVAQHGVRDPRDQRLLGPSGLGTHARHRPRNEIVGGAETRQGRLQGGDPAPRRLDAGSAGGALGRVAAELGRGLGVELAGGVKVDAVVEAFAAHGRHSCDAIVGWSRRSRSIP